MALKKVYTQAEAEQLLTKTLLDMAGIEVAIIGWQRAVFFLASMGAARCDQIQAYNTAAIDLYFKQKSVLDTFRNAAKGTSAEAYFTKFLPQAPPEPVLFGNDITYSGVYFTSLKLDCQGKSFPDPKQLRVFGKLVPGPCPAPGDTGATAQGSQGQTLQSPATLIAACGSAPYGCAMVSVLAVTLAVIATLWTKEVLLALPWVANLEEDRRIIEQNRKRAEAQAECFAQRVGGAAGAAALTMAQRQKISDECANTAQKLYPPLGRRPSFWLVIIPVVVVVGTVVTVYFVTRKKRGESDTVLVPYHEAPPRVETPRVRTPRAPRALHARGGI